MVQIEIGDDIALQNGLVNAVRTITADTTITSTSGSNSGHDYIISINTTSAVTVTLPSDSSRENGRTYYINSLKATPNITVNGNGKNINGSSTLSITGDYNSICVYYNSTADAWFII